MSSDYTAIQSGLTTGLTALSGSMVTMIGNVVPIAVVVMGAVLTVTIAIKVFRRVTGR